MDEPAAFANPYAAPTARVEQRQPADEFVLASRWARLGAYLLDAILAAICFGPGYYAFATASSADPTSKALMAAAVLAALAGTALLTYDIVRLHKHGQTLGKQWLGIRIVRSDGSRAGLGRLLALRIGAPILISAVPIFGRFFGLVDALFVLGDRRRCVHDHMADTIVVDA
ncbi:MAG: RDD family protein [Luteimonas sp.]